MSLLSLLKGFSRRSVGYPPQVPHKLDIRRRGRAGIDEILGASLLQEKAYGDNGFACGNDRTETVKRNRFPVPPGVERPCFCNRLALHPRLVVFGIGVAHSRGTRTTEA